jgi:hypothetical protein
VNPDYEDEIARLVDMDAEKTKYLGGDVKHTHLVKGLDFALLQKVSGRARNGGVEGRGLGRGLGGDGKTRTSRFGRVLTYGSYIQVRTEMEKKREEEQRQREEDELAAKAGRISLAEARDRKRKSMEVRGCGCGLVNRRVGGCAFEISTKVPILPK